MMRTHARSMPNPQAMHTDAHQCFLRLYMQPIGNNIVHKFLLDTRTAELEAEHEQHNDIHFLNSHYSGRAVRFGEKLYLWLKYAHATYPNASYFGRVDDDTYACGGAAFDFVSGNLLNLWIICFTRVF